MDIYKVHKEQKYQQHNRLIRKAGLENTIQKNKAKGRCCLGTRLSWRMKSSRLGSVEMTISGLASLESLGGIQLLLLGLLDREVGTKHAMVSWTIEAIFERARLRFPGAVVLVGSVSRLAHDARSSGSKQSPSEFGSTEHGASGSEVISKTTKTLILDVVAPQVDQVSSSVDSFQLGWRILGDPGIDNHTLGNVQQISLHVVRAIASLAIIRSEQLLD